jgi:periplasmic divalent cation tolerance protein
MPFTPRLVFVTASSVEEARKLTQGIMDQHLAACVNILPGVESHYRWKGELKQDGEVRKHHSYECPEIVAIPLREISPGYRSWWDEVMMQAGEKIDG